MVIDFDTPSESGVYGSAGVGIGETLGIGFGGGVALRDVEGPGIQIDANLGAISFTSMWDSQGWNGFGFSLGPGAGYIGSVTTAGTVPFGRIRDWVRCQWERLKPHLWWR